MDYRATSVANTAGEDAAEGPLPQTVAEWGMWHTSLAVARPSWSPVSDVGRAFPIEVGRGGGRLLVYASRPPQANN